jgi:hypothetical protein
MSSSVIFPLKTSSVFSLAPRETFEAIDRLLKNSLLFFQEIYIESGFRQVTYGDEYSFEVNGPLTLEEYKNGKKRFELVGSLKRDGFLGIRPTGDNEAPLTRIAGGPARTYFVSLQGSLEALIENYSRKELNFIKYFYLPSSSQQGIDNIVSDFSSTFRKEPNSKLNLENICRKWDFGSVNSDRIYRESLNTEIVSRACNSIPIVDELHKDVIGLIDNSAKQVVNPALLQIDTVSKVLDAAIPDYSKFSIPEIIDLRKEPSIEAFRKALTEISASLNGVPNGNVDKKINQGINQRLVRDMSQIAPSSIRSIVISAAVDCILSVPVPAEFSLPITVASLIKTGTSAINDIIKAENWQSSFGCFWLKLNNPK